MLLRVARNEWTVLRHDKGLALLLALLALATFIGALNGARVARGRASEQHRALAAHERENARLLVGLRAAASEAADPVAADARSPRYVSGLGQPVCLPVGPLASLAVGQSDLLPSFTSASIWSASHTLLRNYEIENPTHLSHGRFDLAFVMVWLLPLFLLAATHDVVSAGREDGTWPLALSQPVRPTAVILGRWLPRCLIVLGATLVLSLLGALATGLSPSAPGTAVDLLLWSLLVTAYGAFWSTLGLALALGARTSAGAAVRQAVAWLVLVLLVPAASNLLASSLHPTPSRLAFIQATRAAANLAQERAERTLSHYYADHPELVPADTDPDLNDFMTRFLAISADIQRQVDPLLSEYERRLQRQQALLSALRFTSPAALLDEALSELAGNDGARLRRFQVQARGFLDAWKAFFTPRIFARASLTLADHAALPRFAFADETPATRHARMVWACVGLVLPAALLSLLALRRLGSRRPGDF